MRKLQSQGVHHITIVGAGPADVDRLLGGRARHAVRLRAAEPRQRVGEPPLLRPGRRPADHDLHERGARRRPGAHADRPRLRAPRRVLALAGDVRPGGRAARRARDQPQRRQGPRLHGLDLLRGPARPADRAGLLPLRAAARPHARRRAARGAQAARRARRLQHRPAAPRRRDRGARRRARASRSPTTAPRRTPTGRPVSLTPGRRDGRPRARARRAARGRRARAGRPCASAAAPGPRARRRARR